jgi:hypothetical protein
MMIRGRQSPVVRVLAYRKSKDASLLLTVTPDPLDMYLYQKGSHLITWRLDTKGFRFAEVSPIEFTSPGWETSFTDFRISKDGRTVTAKNQNRDGFAYAYNINVVHLETGEKLFLDPVVGNRNE